MAKVPERQSSVSHQLTGANGTSEVMRRRGWRDCRFGIQCRSGPAQFKAGNKEMHSGRQAPIGSLCGSGGVSGMGMTHVETFCSPASRAPGAAGGNQDSRQDGLPASLLKQMINVHGG